MCHLYRATRLAAVVTLAFAGPAAAQSAEIERPIEVTLERLIEESLAARPELAQADAMARADVERITQAGALPDPMIQLGIQNDGFTSFEVGRMDTSFVSLMAAQTFPWPGKLGLRESLAAIAATQSRHNVSRVRLSTEADVRRAYLDLLVVRDSWSLLDQLQMVWQRSLGAARIRYEAGDGAQSDLLRAQLELNRIKQRRFALAAAEQSALQAINRLRGAPLEAPLETQTHVRDLPMIESLDALFSVERARAQSPELAAARLGADAAGVRVTLAEKSYYPDLTVSAGFMFRGELPPMWSLSVSGPIALFAGQKQDRAFADRQDGVRATQSQVEIIEQLLAVRTAQRRTAYSALQQMVDLYRQGLLIQSEAAAESTLSQYQVGKVAFGAVLEANAGFIADQQAYLEAIAAAQRLLIDEAEISLTPATMPSAGQRDSVAMPGAPSAGDSANAASGGSGM